MTFRMPRSKPHCKHIANLRPRSVNVVAVVGSGSGVPSNKLRIYLCTISMIVGQAGGLFSSLLRKRRKKMFSLAATGTSKHEL